MPYFRKLSDRVYEMDDVVIDLITVARMRGNQMNDLVAHSQPDDLLGRCNIRLDNFVYRCYLGSMN